MTIFRPARESDLAQAYDVFYENEMVDDPTLPPWQGDVPPYLSYMLRTGENICVAEHDGEILAFGASVTRGDVSFLTDLFVRPTIQSSHLGKTLLQRVMPNDEGIRCTMSSKDPRALALYIRSGMRPQWPHFCLRLNGPIRGELPVSDIEISEAEPGDPRLVEWDAACSGLSRPADHAFWVREERAVPLWFLRQGEVIGYGYVRLGVGSSHYPEACMLGPIGTSRPENATACVLAAVDWARHHTNVVRIDVPGPHPGLTPLLNAGFHITEMETFLSTADVPFFDARCYIASGSDLL